MKPLWISLALLALVVVLAAGAGSYGWQRYQRLAAEHASTTERAALLDTQVASAQTYITELTEALGNEKSKNDAFEKRIADIAKTVGFLKKVQETDPELLKKYSKVYFLNENYIPASLSEIDADYVYDKSRTYQILTQVKPHLEELIEDAASDDLKLGVVSSYRSFREQASLKTSYKVTYGTGANAFSADQGYSEHQLGTTVDFTTAKLGANFAGFASTPEYAWLQKNAYKYGFVLSYEKNNAFYQFEPWHWRFVGVELAHYLHQEQKSFYELDQRSIDEYLSVLFD